MWVFGDNPGFISDDTSLIEHVPEDYTAHMLGLRPPIRNMFLLMICASLIPDLSFEYLFFCDDFFLLKDYPIEEARKDRYLESRCRRVFGPNRSAKPMPRTRSHEIELAEMSLHWIKPINQRCTLPETVWLSCR